MPKKKGLNRGLAKEIESRSDETKAKIVNALKKQKGKELNKSQLAKEAGVSRPTINKYPELYEGWQLKETPDALALKKEIKELKQESVRLRKENTSIKEENKKLSDKIVELHVLIVDIAGKNAVR